MGRKVDQNLRKCCCWYDEGRQSAHEGAHMAERIPVYRRWDTFQLQWILNTVKENISIMNLKRKLINKCLENSRLIVLISWFISNITVNMALEMSSPRQTFSYYDHNLWNTFFVDTLPSTHVIVFTWPKKQYEWTLLSLEYWYIEENV